jgi:hypothetical protein
MKTILIIIVAVLLIGCEYEPETDNLKETKLLYYELGRNAGVLAAIKAVNTGDSLNIDLIYQHADLLSDIRNIVK